MNEKSITLVFKLLKSNHLSKLNADNADKYDNR